VFYAVTLAGSGLVSRRELFRLPNVESYDVNRDGTRFLCLTEAASSVPAQLVVLTNWAN
jgi:hypothetical protein